MLSKLVSSNVFSLLFRKRRRKEEVKKGKGKRFVMLVSRDRLQSSYWINFTQQSSRSWCDVTPQPTEPQMIIYPYLFIRARPKFLCQSVQHLKDQELRMVDHLASTLNAVWWVTSQWPSSNCHAWETPYHILSFHSLLQTKRDSTKTTRLSTRYKTTPPGICIRLVGGIVLFVAYPWKIGGGRY